MTCNECDSKTDLVKAKYNTSEVPVNICTSCIKRYRHYLLSCETLIDIKDFYGLLDENAVREKGGFFGKLGCNEHSDEAVSSQCDNCLKFSYTYNPYSEVYKCHKCKKLRTALISIFTQHSSYRHLCLLCLYIDRNSVKNYSNHIHIKYFYQLLDACFIKI